MSYAAMARTLVLYAIIVSLVPAAGILVGAGAQDFVDLLQTYSESIRPQWFDLCSLADMPEEPWPRRLCYWHLTAVGVGITGTVLAVFAVLQTAFLFAAAIWIRRDPRRVAGYFGWVSNVFVTIWSLAVIPRFAIVMAMTLVIYWIISLNPMAGPGVLLTFLALAGGPAIVVLLSQLGTIVRIWRRAGPARNLGYAAAREEAPLLYGFVEQVARTVGIESPDWIVVTIEPEFFVTDAPVRVPNMDIPLRGAIMVLSLPLLRLLTADEAACIVAHELGHLAKPASKGQSDWRAPYAAIVAETDGDRHAWHSPTTWHLGLLPALFNGAVAETLGQEETRADKVALRVARPQTAVAAFFKAIVAQEALEIHANINFDRLEKGAVLDNLSTEAVDLILKVLTTVDPPQLVERVRRLEIGRSDGHTIERRIGNFGYTLDDAAALLKFYPHKGEPARIGDLTLLEERATRHIHRFQRALIGEPGPLPPAEVESMTAFLKG